MSNEEKIAFINEERKIMLSNIKDTLINSSTKAFNVVDSELLNILNEDEKSIKQYEALLEAKELIISLTEEIAMSKSVQDIIEIRKKINYYINRIKRILKKRGVSEEKLESFKEKTKVLRKNISSYLRLLKRENNINNICELNDNIDYLEDEDKKRLKRLLRNEINYIRRKKANDIVQEDIKLEVKEEPIKADTNIEDNKVEIVTEYKVEEFYAPSKWPSKRAHKVLENQSNTPEYFAQRFLDLQSKYNVFNTIPYSSISFENIKILFKNLPIYKYNRSAIRNMEYDFINYYQGLDLALYIEYMKKKNSVREAIKVILASSNLSRREAECLTEHEECVSWINSFIKEEAYTLELLQ